MFNTLRQGSLNMPKIEEEDDDTKGKRQEKNTLVAGNLDKLNTQKTQEVDFSNTFSSNLKARLL